ncbi:hypothetical protein [Arthrobacter parietis]
MEQMPVCVLVLVASVPVPTIVDLDTAQVLGVVPPVNDAQELSGVRVHE